MADRPPPFTHTDIELLRARAALTPGQRLQAMLDARALIAGLIRGRLRVQFPTLSDQALNLKLLEAFERAKALGALPDPLDGVPTGRSRSGRPDDDV